MKRYLLLLIVISAFAGSFAAENAETDLVLQRLEKALRTTLNDIEPDLKFEYDNDFTTLRVKYKTQQFKIHSRNMTGEVSEKAHDETGPSYKGFMLFCEIQPAGTANQAVVPQTLTGPYWKTDLNITPIEGTDKQLYWGLSYGSRTDEKTKLLIKQAIHNLANHDTTKSKSSLVWQDKKTGEVIFSGKDIETFDWENKRILLNIDGALNFMAWSTPFGTLTKTIVIMNGSEEITEGHFVSLISSFIPSGAIYNQSGRLIRISSGYSRSGEEKHFVGKFHDILKRYDLLGEIKEKDDSKKFRIETVSQPWQQSKSGIKARIEFFPQTFRKDANATAHISFASSAGQLSNIDSCEISVLFTSDDGKFHNYITTNPLPVKEIGNGIFSFKFNPYVTSLNSQSSEYFGKGKVKATIIFQKINSTNGTQNTYSTVDEITFPEIKIPVKTKQN